MSGWLKGRQPTADPAGVALGLAIDSVVGDPPNRWHPVAWFGRLMQQVEQRLWTEDQSRGAVYAATGSLVGVAAGSVVRPTALATAVACGGRSLRRTALAVASAVDRNDLGEARRLLPALVGRDPFCLDEPGVCRAAVESVAENAVDAVVAPAFWGAVSGAPGVLGHRAVNTMDALVGHRTQRHARFGTAAARLDDVAAWIPARLTAGLVCLVRPARSSAIWGCVRNDARGHPSPNSGIAEAAWAGALGVRLGGPTVYPAGTVEDRPALGEGPPPGSTDVRRAVQLLVDVEAALAGLLSVAAWRQRRRRRRSPSHS